MKKFLRNMNRGIALLIVLAIGFVTYVVYDNVSFKKEKKPIEDLLKSYYSELAEMSLLPEEYRSAGSKPPKEVIDARRTENRKLIDKYFTTKKIRRGWYDKERALQEMEEMFDKLQNGKGYVTQAEFGFKSVDSIKKIAPNTVIANVSYYYSYRAAGDCMVFCGSGFSRTEWELKNQDDLTDGKLREYKFTDCYAELFLYKTSEGWKIAKSGSTGYSGGMTEPEVVDGNSSKGGTTDGE